MVDFDLEHSTKELIPQELWTESGYDFDENSIWEPSIESFNKNRRYHQEMVSNMLRYKIGDALTSESCIPQFLMNEVHNVNIRGFREPNLTQRVGMFAETDWDKTVINFSYDLVRADELKDFEKDNQVGLYNDVIRGKLHTSKLQLILPFEGFPIVSYQGFNVLNRYRNDNTQRILERITLIDRDYPFGYIENIETKILLSKMAAYIAHHTE